MLSKKLAAIMCSSLPVLLKCIMKKMNPAQNRKNDNAGLPYKIRQFSKDTIQLAPLEDILLTL